MTGLHSLSMIVWQDTSGSSSDLHWIMIAVVLMAFFALVQFLVFCAAGYAAYKGVAEAKKLVNDLHAKANPILQKTAAIIDEMTPKVRTISENVTQMSYTVRAKVEEVGETVTQVNHTVRDINQTVAETNVKTRSQVSHVDKMVSTALTSTEQLTATVVHGINVPVRQVAGWIAGAKTGFDTLVKNFTPKKAGSRQTTYVDPVEDRDL